MSHFPSTIQSWMPSRIDLCNADELGQDQEMAVQRQGMRWHKHDTRDNTQGNAYLATLGENSENTFLSSAGKLSCWWRFAAFVSPKELYP